MVDQNVTVILSTKNKVYTVGTGTDGAIYRLDASTGKVLDSVKNFGATVYHNVLAVFSSYQGLLVLSEVEGDVAADYSTYSYASLSRGYAILYFNAGGRFFDLLYYKKSTSAAMTSSPPVVYCPKVSTASLPAGVLFGGSTSGVAVYYNLGTLLVAGTAPCLFATSSGNQCVICGSGSYLNYLHSCTSACPSGSVNFDGHCAQCNRRCAECSVSQTACSSCGGGMEGWNCACTVTTNVKYEGVCISACPLGTRAVHSGYCVRSCPAYTLTIADWIEQKTNKTVTEAVATPSTILEFSESYKGMKLSMPPSLTAETFPKSFTMTFWVHPKAWRLGGTQFLVKAFGLINLWKADKVISGGRFNYTCGSVGSVTLPTPADDAISTMLAMQENAWTFVGLSKRAVNQSDGKSYVEIHLVTPNRNVSEADPEISDSAATGEVTSVLPDSSYEDARPTSIKSYIVLGGDVNSSTGQLIANTSFSGYIREFKFIGQYMSAQNLLYQKYHSHSPYWHDLLYYVPLNDSVTADVATVKDYSVRALSQSVSSPSTSYPRFIAYPAGIQTLPLHRWDDLYTCWNPLLPGKTIPPVVGSAYIYDSLVSGSTNYVLDSSANPKFSTGDEVRIMNATCDSNSSYLVASMWTTYKDAVATWKAGDAAKPFSGISAGKHYQLCYRSSQYNVNQLLSRIYVAKPPNSIDPPKKLFYSQFESSLLLRSYGGDESYGSRLFLAKSLKDLNLATNTTISMMLKRLDDAYELIVFGNFVQGTYSLYWTPNYSKDYEMYIKLADSHVKKVDNARVYFGIIINPIPPS